MYCVWVLTETRHQNPALNARRAQVSAPTDTEVNLRRAKSKQAAGISGGPYSTRREERVVARSLATRGFGLASSSTTSQSARSAAVTAAAVSRKREILNCRNEVTNHLILVREITPANSHRGEAAGDEGGQKNQGPREAGDERSPKGIEARTKPEEPTLSRKGVQGEIQRHPQATGWTHNGKDRQETTTNFGQQKHQQARGQPTT